MPRKNIVKRDEVYRRRADSWSAHYQNREVVRAMSNHWNAATIIKQLERLPSPQMGIDGRLLDYPIDTRRELMDEKILPESLSCLLCVWYWSESGWRDLVHLYQGLPEVYEDYYWRYQPEPWERLVLFPVSTNGPRGRSYKSARLWVSGSPKVQPSYVGVDNPVEKTFIFSSPKVQVRSFQQVEASDA